MVSRESSRRRRRRRRTRRVLRVVGWSLIAAVGVVGVALAWTAVDALRVREQLLEAAEVVPRLEEQVLAGDDDAVNASVETVRDAASAAVATTSRPHWWLSARLPGAGPNVRAVQTLSRTVSDLAEGPLPSLPEVVQAASPATLTPRDGRIDVASIASQSPAVIAADDGVAAAIAAIDGIDRRAVLEPVDDAVGLLREQLVQLRTSTATAARAVALIPPMMGHEGPREYLVLVQNNAEPRALGGIVGAVLRLRADAGAIELVEQVPGSSVIFSDPVVPLSDAERALFGTQLGRFMLNVTSTPDFPRSAELASAMWSAERGQQVDGVLSIDPVALTGLLGATGPVTTEAGTVLTVETAAEHLLNQIYLDVPEPAQQDAFFADAARSIFDALSNGIADPGGAVGSLAAAADDGRVLLWSAHPQEQELLSGTVLSGELAPAGGPPVIGLFQNDGTGAKAGYYVQQETSLTVSSCRPDGSQRVDVVTTLTSALPDPATLPPYVTGGGAFTEPGVIRTNVLLYAPSGGTLLKVTSDGAERPVLTQEQQGRSAASTTVEMRPGQSVTLSYELLTAPRSAGVPQLRTTPGPRQTDPVVEAGCAGSS